jgi:nucleoside-diphosphate-sugar epimerase
LDYEPIDYYEPGEYTPVSMSLDYVDKPIKIDIDVTSMQPTWWKPKYTLYDGLKETYNYFLTIFSRDNRRDKQ